MSRVATTMAVALFLVGQAAWSADWYVRETLTEGLNESEVTALQALVEDVIQTSEGERLVAEEDDADFILQPRVLRLGEAYIFRMETLRDDQLQSSTQTKTGNLNSLDQEVRSLTTSAMEQAPGQRRSRAASNYRVQNMEAQQTGNTAANAGAGMSETRSTTTAQELQPKVESRNAWMLGFGPFFSNRLESDNVMYHLMAGHLWEVHPQADIKIVAEANFASSSESAQFYNLGAGANYFFNQTTTGSPYLTGDIGIGAAETDTDESASGFSFGAGVGYQFFRNTDRSLDLQLRYATIADSLETTDGVPSVVGARLSVIF